MGPKTPPAGSGNASPAPQTKATSPAKGVTPISSPPRSHHKSGRHPDKGPCPHLCTLVPIDVPGPDRTQAVLHPRKDVFVLKVAKVGPHGDRRCRMELELVTPKANTRIPAYRVDTRETQCDPECTCCCKRICEKRTK